MTLRSETEIIAKIKLLKDGIQLLDSDPCVYHGLTRADAKAMISALEWAIEE